MIQPVITGMKSKYIMEINISIRKSIMLFTSLFFLGYLAGAQNTETTSAVDDLLTTARIYYGPNDLLERGLVFIPEHPKANGHPYFSDREWNNGTIFMPGELFNGLQLKYNVAADQLILRKHIKGTGVNQPILLNNGHVDGFTLDGIRFYNLEKLPATGSMKGFGEIIYQGHILLIRKHSKTFINQYSKTNPMGLYTKLVTNNYIIVEGSAKRVYNKRSLINVFPAIRKELRKKMREMHFKFKKANDLQWNELMKWCDGQLSE